MATIKSYTDISQSKTLSKILPLESADMCWQYQTDRWVGEPDYQEFPQFEHVTDKRDIPCWSLSALLGVLPNGIVMYKDSKSGRYHFSSTHTGTCVTADNPVDACVAMIERLHELKML